MTRNRRRSVPGLHLPPGYRVENVAAYDGGADGYSYAAPDGGLGDDAWGKPEGARLDAWRDYHLAQSEA